MRFDLEPSVRSRIRLITLASLAALLAGCAYGRIQGYADQVEQRFLGESAARALNELGVPSREYRVADLRSYVWQTGEYGQRGVALAVPAWLGEGRIQSVVELSLDPVDRVAFETAAQRRHEAG